MLDHYIGQIITFLEKTPDPRRPGHSLFDNTYIIFTSDNGGMERIPGEIITDNFPLDKGKLMQKKEVLEFHLSLLDRQSEQVRKVM